VFTGCAIINARTTSNANLQDDPDSANKESQGPGNADQNEQPDDGITEVAAAHLAKLTPSAFSLVLYPSNTRLLGGRPAPRPEILGPLLSRMPMRGAGGANVNLTGLGMDWFIPDHALTNVA
jgi:hypothetical protein